MITGIHALIYTKQAEQVREFFKRTLNICDLYTRQLTPWERVLCLDEKTSIQPRPRTAETQPAAPGLKAVLNRKVDHVVMRAAEQRRPRPLAACGHREPAGPRRDPP